MNSYISKVLSEIHSELRSNSFVLAEGHPTPDQMDPEQEVSPLPSENYGASAPKFKANAADTDQQQLDSYPDALDDFLSSLVDRIQSQYDASDELAANIMFDCIDDLIAKGKLPEMPDADVTDPKETMAWVGKATTIGLGKLVDDFSKLNSEVEDKE